MSGEVLVVDDSALQRTMIRDAISDEFSVVGEAETGVEAIDKAAKLGPDIITMDVNMPEMDGITATAEIKESADPPAVIMATSVDQAQKMKEAVQAGADSYVTKPFEDAEIRTELQKALSS
jgi:two-component system chemotaxis response regulator CheY